ncbi:copper radical oxidase [Microthyrium microscopicum]|uniref:Copper radical oxidase n=1 Tax=Microthyrium microscopicum TaxID=703497 RepID=A0A6A6UCS5_9PEZI|nr:copper radical oxidase [Microthyrium microscopicum]
MTSSSSSSASSAAPTGWQSLGCWTDAAQRTFANGINPPGGVKMTVEVCQGLCLAKGYTYAGVEYADECYCDSTPRNGGGPAPDGSVGCNMACQGNATEMCGGSFRLNAYQYLAAPGASATSSSAPPTPTGLGIPAGWSYKGCWQDNYNNLGRSMGNEQTDDQSMTIASCVAECQALGYSIAGMEYSYQCFCDNFIRNGAPPGVESDCSTACAGDSTETCGGPNRLSLYSSINGTVPVLPVPQIQKTGIGNWTYSGCMTDNNNTARALPWQLVSDTNTTVAGCLAQCQKYGYPSAGLEYGSECYCGDPSNLVESGSTPVADGQCNFVCSGNATTYCGGPRIIAYYTWQGTPFYVWNTPTDPGEYQNLIGGVVVPLITTLGVNGKVTFLEKVGTGAINSTGGYELDLTLTDDFSSAWRVMHPASDVFCSAALTLPDKFGRQLNIGGWSGTSTYGVRLYTPDGSAGVNGTNDWLENPDILASQDGRWYPSAMIMANGSALIVGGESGSNAPPVPTLELLPAVGAPLYMEWLERTDPWNLYPFMAVLPSGGIFACYFNEAIILDEKTFATTRTLPPIPGNVNNDLTAGRTYPLEGTMVLLPQKAPYTDPVTVLICGGSTQGQGEAIDNCISTQPEVNGADWVIERMPSKRVMSCIAELPDGTYLILNGAMQGVAGFGLAINPNYDAVLYDPSKPIGQRMSKMNSTIVARMYHSEAITLLDGRVLVTGSDPQDQTGTYPEEYRVEVFIPAYLRSGLPRPSFSITEKDWAHGQSVQFTLTSGSTGSLRVSLLGAVSSTHGNSMGQRTIFPEFSCAGTTCTIVSPPNSHVCPPGWFKLFVLDGPTPSIGQWVRIGQDGTFGSWPNDPYFYPLPGV